MAHDRKNLAEGAEKRAKVTAAKILKDKAVRRALRKSHVRAGEADDRSKRLAAG